MRKQEKGSVAGGEGLHGRFLNLRNGISAPMVVGQGTAGFVQCARNFILVAPFVKLKLFKCQPEAFFLMADGFLSIDKFLLFQFDPLRVKPETVLDFDHVTVEAL